MQTQDKRDAPRSSAVFAFSATETMCTTRLKMLNSKAKHTAARSRLAYRRHVQKAGLHLQAQGAKVAVAAAGCRLGGSTLLTTRISLRHCEGWKTFPSPSAASAALSFGISQSQGHGTAAPDGRHRFAGHRCKRSLSECQPMPFAPRKLLGDFPV